MTSHAQAGSQISEPVLFEQLVEAVDRLAKSYGDQQAWLRQVGLDGEIVDELALEFDEALTLYRSHYGSGRLSDVNVLLLTGIDQALSEMSGQEQQHLWTAVALEDHPKWKEVRALASSFLSDVAA